MNHSSRQAGKSTAQKAMLEATLNAGGRVYMARGEHSYIVRRDKKSGFDVITNAPMVKLAIESVSDPDLFGWAWDEFGRWPY